MHPRANAILLFFFLFVLWHTLLGQWDRDLLILKLPISSVLCPRGIILKELFFLPKKGFGPLNWGFNVKSLIGKNLKICFFTNNGFKPRDWAPVLKAHVADPKVIYHFLLSILSLNVSRVGDQATKLGTNVKTPRICFFSSNGFKIHWILKPPSLGILHPSGN